jgi:adenylosuccinate synthase
MDLVALQYACMINGVTSIVMTKADVLDAFEDL